MRITSILFSKSCLTCCLVFALFTQNSKAALSNGSDGAFFINDAYTLNATNNQIFNFTTFDILSSGILNFSGLLPTDTVTFLTTGDINIGGILNINSNIIFETLGDIYITGSVSAPLRNTSFYAGSGMNPTTTINAAVVLTTPFASGDFVIGGNVSNIVGINGSIIIADGTITAVPEPKTYLQILCGLALLAVVKRKSLYS